MMPVHYHFQKTKQKNTSGNSSEDSFPALKENAVVLKADGMQMLPIPTSE